MSNLFSVLTCLGIGSYWLGASFAQDGLSLDHIPWDKGFWAVGCITLFLVIKKLYSDIGKPAADAHIALVNQTGMNLKTFADESIKRTELDRQRLEESKQVTESLTSINQQLKENCKFVPSTCCQQKQASNT